MSRRQFGNVRKMRSGRYQARYTGPDGNTYPAPMTFERIRATKKERGLGLLGADDWLAQERSRILAGTWIAPGSGDDRTADESVTFEAFAEHWLRERDLKQRTRDHYRYLLDAYLLPTFGHAALTNVTTRSVRGWYAQIPTDKPTVRAHAYGLLRTIMGDAVTDDSTELTANPVHIRGAGSTKRARTITPLSLDQLETLVKAMPDRHRVLTLLTAWCAFRFGEAAELRRMDVDLGRGVIRVRRGVVTTKQGRMVGDPKSDAGTRPVHVPPHLVPALKDHLSEHVGKTADALLFPASDGVTQLAPSSLYGKAPTDTRKGHGFYRARAVAGVPDLSWHGLRHTGSVLAAAAGATQAELMQRLGHSTAAASQRYQHAAKDADKAIAEALSRIATGKD